MTRERELNDIKTYSDGDAKVKVSNSEIVYEPTNELD